MYQLTLSKLISVGAGVDRLQSMSPFDLLAPDEPDEPDGPNGPSGQSGQSGQNGQNGQSKPGRQARARRHRGYRAAHDGTTRKKCTPVQKP